MKNNIVINEDGTVFKNGKPINTWEDKNGYLICKVGSRSFRLHRLIAEKFIPNPNKLKTVNHKDGNKKNNKVSNLEWMSFSQNAKHSWENGLAKPRRGEKHGRSKLTQDDVDYIRSLPLPSKNGRGGVPATELAKKFNVNVATIRRLRRGESWINDSNTD